MNRLALLASVSVLTLWSCQKDFLDTKIDFYSTPTSIITNRSTLYSFANDFYTALPYGFTAIDNNFFAAVSDDGQQTELNGSGALLFNQGVLSPTVNPDADSYRNLYEGIRAANFYLDYSKDYKSFLQQNRDTVADVTSYNNDLQLIGWYRGEAHIARAYYYAELLKRYGGVPIVTKDFSSSDSLYLSRSSYDEVVNYIVKEIDQYKDSVQVNWNTSSFKDQAGRFSLASALALKSRVLLYAASPLNNPSNDAAKWQAAADAAWQTMNTPGLNLSLNPSYAGYFSGNNSLNSDETILAVRRPADNNPERKNYPIATPGGNSGVTPTGNLVDAYEYTATPDASDPYKNRDPRLAATVVTNGSSWNGRTIDESPGGTDDMANRNASRTGYYLKKFLTDNLNLVNNGTAQHNWIIFRYAEILLNYAEAVNELVGPDQVPAGYPMTAREALQQIRNRASSSLPAITAMNKDEFRNAVKHERRVELAFEDHRYWDLLRWKDAETTLNQPVKGIAVSKNASGAFGYSEINVAQRIFRAPAMYRYPISQIEIANSKGRLTQNEGY